ncbi:putative programmed cell death protein [Helianthus annuus]|nr:putative programmed cell death protein [Helianthus annuus]
MSKEVITNANDGSIVNLTNMRISSLDDEEYEEYDDEDDDDDEEFEDEAPVTLGFVEKPKHEWSLLRHLFPSKAGGTPAWLNPVNLPSGKACLCDICGEPLRFLLQAYAPIVDDPLVDTESTFHRTLFVFMCTSMSCLLQDQHEQWKHHPEKGSRSVKVFRSQLPHHNQFYSSEPPKNDGSDKPLGTAAPLCSWCGTWKGDKVCSNCKRARYCSKTHQAIHWSSTHKTQCRTIDLMLQPSNSAPTNSSDDIPKAASNDTWPEYEIINEDEPELDPGTSNVGAYGNALRNDNEDEGDAKSWAYFTQRIARAPEQVLRYSRREKPLWPMLSGRPSKTDIPKCSSCGSDRAFEFQILPQLLYYFDVKNESNSLDWATIAVYTCEASCDGSLAYEEEFCWVQLTSQSN